jgi:hypothetical protein
MIISSFFSSKTSRIDFKKIRKFELKLNPDSVIINKYSNCKNLIKNNGHVFLLRDQETHLPNNLK